VLWQAHIVDLEEFVAVLRKAVSDAEKTAKPPTSGEGKSSTSKSVLELERVINAMKKVIGMLCHEGVQECVLCLMYLYSEVLPS